MLESQQLLFRADQKRGQKPWVSAFLNGVLTCPAANKDHRLCTSSPCLTGPPSVRLSVWLAGWLAGRLTDWLTEVSSHVPELICNNGPGRGQLCQRYTSAPGTADFFFIFYFCTSRLLRADVFLWRFCQVTRGQRELVELDQAVFGGKRRFLKDLWIRILF